jgi:hypothetical protein
MRFGFDAGQPFRFGRLSLVQAELFGGERLDANFGLGDLFEDGIERFAACLEAVGGMSSVRLAPCPLDDQAAVALFELAELGERRGLRLRARNREVGSGSVFVLRARPPVRSCG